MGRLNPRHLDHRRSLTPRDYADDPTLFGVVANVAFHVPSEGDEVSMWIAYLQHLLVCEWTAFGRQPSATGLCRRFHFSPQTLSKVATGQRWAGETVLSALHYATRDVAHPNLAR